MIKPMERERKDPKSSGKKTEIQSLFSFVHHGKNDLIVAKS